MLQRPASRSVCAAWFAQRLVLPLMTLPAVILVPGHKPSQQAKCLSGGNRLMSVPISPTTTNAVVTSVPWSA